jgi:rRNA maturation protein Nop10
MFFLKDGIPECPAGGTYTIKAADTVPTCSVPGHAMPQ